MASKAGAYIAVIAGGIAVYSAFEHKRIIDVLLMRSSTLPQQAGGGVNTNSTGTPLGNENANTGSISATTPLRQAVCNAALQATEEPQGTYEYSETRPYPPDLFTPPPVKTDCSGFFTLAYKKGGAPDPNGLGYSGEGFTGTLLARGRSTNTPQPGDGAFWSNPDHVGLYIGDGMVVEFGAPPGPTEQAVVAESAFHTQFLGYRSFLPTK
jgi:cell wall-associated NlpC family hydrolase